MTVKLVEIVFLLTNDGTEKVAKICFYDFELNCEWGESKVQSSKLVGGRVSDGVWRGW